jgi:hypothetical protein
MIEIIALTAAAALVPAIAAFAWIAKKRVDELQDEIFLLTDEIRALRHQAKNPEYYEMARQYPAFPNNQLGGPLGGPKTTMGYVMTREEQLERAKQNTYADALNNALRKAGEE